jgi:plastocyanin
MLTTMTTGKTILRGALFAAVLLLAATTGQTRVPDGEPSRDVQGHVTLTLANSRAVVKDASNVVVWLVPLGARAGERPVSEPHKYQMAQRNKSFQPPILVVPIGTEVDFPNFDPWFHNVFSLYQGKRFDLGLYEAGSRKQVLFDRPGPSYIFCNIHPQMHAVVMVVDSNYFAISNKSGRVSISGVPAGKYAMHVWYEEASPKALQSLDREVAIAEGSRDLPPVTLAAVRQDPMKHKNKYGEDYDPKDQAPTY